MRYITISIYPAYTEYRKPIETSITIYSWLDPKKLNNRNFINSLWNDFMSYMEYTSLDGKPTFKQKLRISYLRNLKHLTIGSNWFPTKSSIFCKDILKYVLTVGLSGFIFYIAILIKRPKETKAEILLENTNKKIDKISIQLDKILNKKKSTTIT